MCLRCSCPLKREEMRRSGGRCWWLLLSVRGLCWVCDWDWDNGQIYDLVRGTSVVLERVREGIWMHSQGPACRTLLIGTNGKLPRAGKMACRTSEMSRLEQEVRAMRCSLGFVYWRKERRLSVHIYKACHMPHVQCNMPFYFYLFFKDKESILISKSSYIHTHIYVC